MKNNDKDIIRVLKVDLEWLDKRVIQLDKLIMGLADEFREAFTQSSETWHDNAMFDNVREKQNVLSAEQQNLWAIRKKAFVVKPPTGRKKTVQVGNTVILTPPEGNEMKLIIGGDYISPDLALIDGVKRISVTSPIGLQLEGKLVGDKLQIGHKSYTLAEILKL